MASTCIWAGEYGSDFKVGKLDYNITSATTVEVTSQEYWTEDGKMYNYHKLTTAIIPSTVTYNGKTYSVTRIGEGAFMECNWLKSVTIPNSVTSIESSAFYFTPLTSIIIPESVTHIEEDAFGDCSDLSEIYVCSKKEFEAFSEFDVTYYDKIVDGCIISDNTIVALTNSPTNITSINIPDGVAIGAEAFSETSIYNNKSNWENGALYIDNCLISVDQGVSGNYAIKPGTRLIADGAFRYCSSLESVTIPESVTAIGYGAFDQCEALTSITIPEGVTSIGAEAFQGCSNLTNITIPESVTSIGIYALRSIDKWENGALYINNCLIAVKQELSGNYSIKPGTRLIADGAFEQCSDITSITIPNSVTHIGKWAFSGCSKLNSILIPESVTSIREKAFDDCEVLEKIFVCSKNKYQALDKYSVTYYDKIVDGCVISNNTIIAAIDPTKMTSLVIPAGVTTIKAEVFKNCSELTSITIPASVTSIEKDAFAGCQSIKRIIVFGDGKFDALNAYHVVNCDNIVDGLIIKNNQIRDVVDANQLTSVTIHENVTGIEDGAFKDCKALTSVTINSKEVANYSNFGSIFGQQVKEYIIGNNVTSIREMAFQGCSNLTNITIPASVASIGEGAFAGCSSLTTITIPESVTEISSSVFAGCSQLTSIAIPEGVTNIGEKAFDDCSALATIVWNAKNCGTSSPFAAIKQNITSFVLGDKVELIPASLCSGMSQITSITIPMNVASIGEGAFAGCSSLTSITIPESVTKIESSMFASCSSLATITLPDSVAEIGSSAFAGCSKLSSITIPEGVTNIGEKAFDECSSLTSIVWNAKNCGTLSPFDAIKQNITSFVLGDKVELIPASLCSGMSQITSINIPMSVTSVGEGAFMGCEALQIINYADTKKLWKKLPDTNLTIEPKKQIVVICSDGELKLRGK